MTMAMVYWRQLVVCAMGYQVSGRGEAAPEIASRAPGTPRRTHRGWGVLVRRRGVGLSRETSQGTRAHPHNPRMVYTYIPSQQMCRLTDFLSHRGAGGVVWCIGLLGLMLWAPSAFCVFGWVVPSCRWRCTGAYCSMREGVSLRVRP